MDPDEKAFGFNATDTNFEEGSDSYGTALVNLSYPILSYPQEDGLGEA